MQLKLNDVSIGYETILCSSINLTLSVGEVYVFLGSNGLGKTTFFKSLVGVCPIKSGEVSLDGGPVGQAIAFVGTQRPVIDYLSVEDYLSFGFVSISDQSVDELLKQFAIYDYRFKSVKELSDGQFKKLALVRQLLKKPKVLLLDEPSAYLDIENKQFLCEVLQKLKSSCIVLLSTHDVDFAKKCGDQFFRLAGKKISPAVL